MVQLNRLIECLCNAGIDRCRVIPIEALIQAKQAMGREKDMIAVKELRAIAEKQGGNESSGNSN